MAINVFRDGPRMRAMAESGASGASGSDIGLR